ncbi:WG containing repeat-containing protein [Moraxella cuniculi DSM 21768]|uniref:WG containing repeat-containing protein n=2 Tax=Moraxella cuniculi TaxID=34061 RepID=A0A1N7FXV2_9GAMM|nr:WG containing repeat-containing protein [Moraxella cuniculi DSM 21768]
MPQIQLSNGGIFGKFMPKYRPLVSQFWQNAEQKYHREELMKLPYKFILSAGLMLGSVALANQPSSTLTVDEESLPACTKTALPEGVEFAIIYPDCGYVDGLAPVIKEGKYGFADTTGKLVIATAYQEAHPFSNNLALYRQNGKYGYLDRTGKVAIKPQFEDAWGFWEGRAKVAQNGKYGFIDSTGKMVIKPQFEVVGDWFEDGLVLFKQGDKYGFLDKSGKVAIKPQFDSAKSFSEGLAAVTKKTGLTDAQGVPLHKFGFIDTTGKVVIELKYDLVYDFFMGASYVVDGESSYYIDKSGNRTNMPKYQ